MSNEIFIKKLEEMLEYEFNVQKICQELMDEAVTLYGEESFIYRDLKQVRNQTKLHYRKLMKDRLFL